MTPDLAALRAIGWPCDTLAGDGDWAVPITAHPEAVPMRVAEQHRSGYIATDGVVEPVALESLLEWQRPRFPAQDRAAVGDWVLVEGVKIVALLPRRSGIKRAAAGEHYKQQVIAANIDTVFVVCGLDNDFNPRRIERYLMLVAGSGARPVIVLTKADLEPDEIAGAMAALYEVLEQGTPVLHVNARDPAEVDALRPWLGPGRTAVLVGSSGAGKSTLTNTLLGHDRMKTGAVRDSDDRGRHTTTYRALLPLPSGACLIDTPGMRELKPTGEETVGDAGFADIEALADQCRFRDCRHDREPGCAIRAAIAAGTLDPARFANYLKLRDEVAGAATALATRLAQKADARVQSKALGKRIDDKYGRD